MFIIICHDIPCYLGYRKKITIDLKFSGVSLLSPTINQHRWDKNSYVYYESNIHFCFMDWDVFALQSFINYNVVLKGGFFSKIQNEYTTLYFIYK